MLPHTLQIPFGVHWEALRRGPKGQVYINLKDWSWTFQIIGKKVFAQQGLCKKQSTKMFWQPAKKVSFKTWFYLPLSLLPVNGIVIENFAPILKPDKKMCLYSSGERCKMKDIGMYVSAFVRNSRLNQRYRIFLFPRKSLTFYTFGNKSSE